MSFKYPVELNVPVFSLTNTYVKDEKRKDKVKIVSYIDGPFFQNKDLTKKEQQKELRDKVYECMVKRSKNSNMEYIKYVREE